MLAYNLLLISSLTYVSQHIQNAMNDNEEGTRSSVQPEF